MLHYNCKTVLLLLLPGVLKLAIKLVTSMSNPKWVSENYSCLHLPHPPIGRPIHSHAHTVTHTNTPAGTDPPVFFLLLWYLMSDEKPETVSSQKYI